MPFKTGAIPRPIPPVAVPRDAMLESQQGHINDLVQRNRTLDQACKKLKDELQREESRAKDAIKEIQARWQEERVEWREGCDTLLACHRIVQLRTAVELDKERLALVKLDDLMRKEKLARLQRDYKITMFQVKESEMDNRVAELEDELADLKERNEGDIQRMEEENANATQKLLKKCADLSSELTRTSEALSAAQRERDDAEDEFSRLREEIAQLNATVESTTSKLERVTLQLDGAKTANAELEHLNDDLKRNEASIRRQLDKWQNLENKGGAEVETMRKRRIELEVQVKELQGRLGDTETREQENAKAVEKEKSRVVKLKEILAEWRQTTEEAQEDAEKHQNEAAEAAKQLAKAQKQISKLKADLAVERAKGASAGKKSTRKSPDATEDDQATSSEDEVVHEIVKSPTPAAPAKARAKAKKPVPGSVSDDGSNVKSKAAAKKDKGKQAIAEEGSDSDTVEPSLKAKGKRKAVLTEDSDILEKGVQRKGAKDAVGTTGRKAGRRGVDLAVDDPPKARPVASQAPSTQEEGSDFATKKKKRKINIFGSAQDTTFAWGQMPQGNNDLGIPTILSPVKETEAIPNRSASILGKMGSVIGSFRR